MPQIKSFDGTGDQASWLVPGHVLEQADVDFIRDLFYISPKTAETAQAALSAYATAVESSDFGDNSDNVERALETYDSAVEQLISEVLL